MAQFPQLVSKRTGLPLGQPLGEALIELFGIEVAQKRMLAFVDGDLSPAYNVVSAEFRAAALAQVGL